MDASAIGLVEEPYIETKEVNEWIRFGMRLFVSAALHPFRYAKVLIQLGYEPIAPRPGTSLLGKPTMIMPNIFQYAAFIQKRDGFYGCYRGLAPKMVGAIFSTVLSEKMLEHVNCQAIDAKLLDSSTLDGDKLYMQYKMYLKRDTIITTTGIVASYPFHVISLRMMAQFIGRETIYKSIYGSICEIYKTEGIAGFYAGIGPKLLYELGCLVLTSTTVFILNKYCIKDKISRQYNAGLTQFFFASILYPLQVVSACMTINGTRLLAGRPPRMPYYKHSYHCWTDLHARGELKRGGTLFWRSKGRQDISENMSRALLALKNSH